MFIAGTNEYTPRKVIAVQDAFMIKVACGTFHTLMLTRCKGRSGGEMYVCGGAYEGRLGQGPLADNLMYPCPIGGAISALPVVQISCNMLHNIARYAFFSQRSDCVVFLDTYIESNTELSTNFFSFFPTLPVT